ncbi:MAG: hypothetical protein KDC74_10095 [Flavobacteriaceae bacterium]|nr:hypothetical protein [Flavobacteriaceae bacterium]
MRTLNTMTFLICLLTALPSISQDRIGFAVYQDARLGIIGDKEHGYKAGTMDVLIRLKMQGKQQKYGYMTVFPEFEYAEIQGLYKRWSINAGYAFNRLFVRNTEASISIGFGLMDRYSMGFLSMGANGELAYKITDGFKIAANFQLVQRKDLDYMWGGNNIRLSGHVGIEIKIWK